MTERDVEEVLHWLKPRKLREICEPHVRLLAGIIGVREDVQVGDAREVLKAANKTMLAVVKQQMKTFFRVAERPWFTLLEEQPHHLVATRPY